MEGSQNQTTNGESAVPVQMPRGLRGFKPFRNPPQPHMCILTYIKDTVDKIYINVLSWKQIANPKHHTDPIPLYGGMQIPQGYAANSDKGPLLVFAVMVNPEILKVNGKNATNREERDAFVNLLCEFVEAMNPNLRLTGKASVLKDRDFAGELKDVWVAVQTQREREKIRMPDANSDVTHKIYHIDGPSNPNVKQSTELNSDYTKCLDRDSVTDRKLTEPDSKSHDGDSPKHTNQSNPANNQSTHHQTNVFPNRIITDEIESLDRKASNSNSIRTEFSNKAFGDNTMKNSYNLKINNENVKSDVDENKLNSDVHSQNSDVGQSKNLTPSHPNNVPLSNISNLSESNNLTGSCQNDRLKENGSASKQTSSTSHIPIKLPSVKRKNPKPSDSSVPSKNFYPVFDNPVANPEIDKAGCVNSVAIDGKHLNPVIPTENKKTESKSILSVSVNDTSTRSNNTLSCGNSASKQTTINNTKNSPHRPIDKQSNMNATNDQTVQSNSDMVKFIEKLNLSPNNTSETTKNSWNNTAKEPQTTLSSK